MSGLEETSMVAEALDDDLMRGENGGLARLEDLVESVQGCEMTTKRVISIVSEKRRMARSTDFV